MPSSTGLLTAKTFDDPGREDVAYARGMSANLCELAKAGLPVPAGMNEAFLDVRIAAAERRVLLERLRDIERRPPEKKV